MGNVASAVWKTGDSKTKTSNGKPLLSVCLTALDKSHMSSVINQATLSKADGEGMKSKQEGFPSPCRRGCISGFQRNGRQLVFAQDLTVFEQYLCGEHSSLSPEEGHGHEIIASNGLSMSDWHAPR